MRVPHPPSYPPSHKTSGVGLPGGFTGSGTVWEPPPDHLLYQHYKHLQRARKHQGGGGGGGAGAGGGGGGAEATGARLPPIPGGGVRTSAVNAR